LRLNPGYPDYSQSKYNIAMKSNFSVNQTARNRIKELLTITKKKSDFQRVQCVWLRLEFNMQASQVATITNLQPGTVRKVWSLYGREGEKALFCSRRGGRRNSNLSQEEEKLLLTPFFKKTKRNKNILDIREIQESYEKVVGKKVPKSTIYRLLSRHGWQRKPGTKKTSRESCETRTDMHEYWIEGCSQVLHPERTGNISQQWLNSTLQSMVKHEKNPQ
jgi:transposase